MATQNTEIASKIIPSLSIDCVVLGFHEKQLKVLLCKLNAYDKWMLPGGFVSYDENVDEAAYRALLKRTNLTNIYLSQFHVFGDKNRIDIEENKRISKLLGFDKSITDWWENRFNSVGYYALINLDHANIIALEGEEIRWFELDQIPKLYADHNNIIDKALETIRKQVGTIPVGYELLPKKFTMPELRCIYEAILGERLDRRNFQRKMLSTGVFIALNETRKIGAHKSPNLYSFDEKNYQRALQYGFDSSYAKRSLNNID